MHARDIVVSMIIRAVDRGGGHEGDQVAVVMFVCGDNDAHDGRQVVGATYDERTGAMCSGAAGLMPA